jgi:hypothetical protein
MGPVPEARNRGYLSRMREQLVGRKDEALGGGDELR